MRMISLKQATHLLKKLPKTKGRKKLVLLTRKKDRSLTIEIKKANLILTEQGYENSTQAFPLASRGAKHVLLAAFKREFPRSHRVYINLINNLS